MLGKTRIGIGLLAVALLMPLLAAQELEKLRQRLARERDADDRAKITVKIGKELLKQISRSYEKDDTAEAERLLDEYLKAVNDAHKDLKQSGRDARRKPKGFKDLEIHLRRSERALEDIGHLVSFDQRQPLEEAQAEIDVIRQELLEDLMRRDNPDADEGSNR